jgi:AI-2 transport protein TqsA
MSTSRLAWPAWILAVVAVLWLLRAAAAVVVPFLVALFLAFGAFPIVDWLSSHHMPRWLASTGLALVAAGALAGLGWLTTAGVVGLVDTVQRKQERIDALWQDAVRSLGAEKLLRSSGGLGRDVARSLTGAAAAVAGSTANLVTNVVLVGLYVAFLFGAQSRLPGRVSLAFGPERERSALDLLHALEHQMLRYVWLRTVISLLTAAGYWVVLALYGVESAALWASLAFVAQFVPYIGPLLATVFPIGMALLQFHSPWTAAWIAGWLTAWSVLMGNVVEAKVMGQGMNLSPVLILFGLAFFSWMWGLVGVFLAVPVLATLKLLLERFERTRPAALLMAAHVKAG